MEAESKATEARHPLDLPPPEQLREIERKQNERAAEIRARRRRESVVDERTKAAEVIQRTYKGHRDRRALKGYGLDSSTRWLEGLKDAEYNKLTRVMSRSARFNESQTRTERARSRWAQAGKIALHAGDDNTSDSDDRSSHAESMAKKRAKKAEREKYAKMMGLDYFLEMVDQKHRYGSSLRRYHQEWMRSDTKENFFYWLDYGEGKDLDLPDRPRERLEREQVRYLSVEERRKYLVRIDEQGLLVWDKDGKAITTSPDFKDSIDGIVHSSEDKPTWREVTTGEKAEPRDTSSDSSSIGSKISTGSHEDASKYANEEFHDAKGLSKLNHVSVDALMNHLLRKTTKRNTWIFVADTSFRLYIGIKQSGAFQHSSFLKGARVAAAGLIKIKRGQIRKLSPLSGHYAPPVRNFREFLKSLKEAGADLSRLNVSRSYAVILGLEGYVKVKKKAKDAKQSIHDVLDPEEKRKRIEMEKDKSQSAEIERQVLAQEAQERRSQSKSFRMMKRLGSAKTITTRSP
ncbi:uncharacterized protein MYCFIDRAFT_156905 [Pseudocercospora fijiensis CIRAD86]|uniref:IQ calmodulin-binding motif protein n=1 Tax=Pseudocercospora fijiensis (strain CIRAD86) TaxID=383855 RepID=M2YPH5_PSEFD|nr:uncharacterized protein MYCFIDRAFT_156905 [Pseudocercospora fijiensis CIRAD86]EME79650.1 hypothetical protein MYCFIDRAFT_156905 [Pseudocercospora fijiensis CIRAD86]